MAILATVENRANEEVQRLCCEPQPSVVNHREPRVIRLYRARRNFRARQMRKETANHITDATSRTNADLQTGSSFQTTRPKHANPMLPIAAPRASRAAARRPRIVRGIPARRFFWRSCFSMRVRLEGKIAGKARKRPPKTGPYRFARMPVTTVIAPPNKKREAYSPHVVLRNTDASK